MDELNVTPMDIYNENKEYLDLDTIVYYLLKGGELDGVPEEFITPKLFKEYILKGGMLINVPKPFITQELFNDYFYKNYSSKTFLLDMPEDIITENMIEFFIQNCSEKEWIRYIPDKFITDDLKERYISSVGGIKAYISEMRKSLISLHYLDLTEFLDIVPEKYIEEVCTEYLKTTHSLKKFPREYLTENVKEKVFLSLGGLDSSIDYFTIDWFYKLITTSYDTFRIDIVPEKYKVVLCEKIFEKRHQVIDGLFDDYWSEDLIKKSIKNTRKIPKFVIDNPEKYINILLYYYELTEDLSAIPIDVRTKRDVRAKVMELHIAKNNDIEERAKIGDIDYLLTVYNATNNIDLIPPELHEEVYRAYLFKYDSIVGIPKRYLMPLCTEYFERKYFIDGKISNSAISDYLNKHSSNPEGYAEFIKNHFAETFSLEEIPYILGHRSMSVKSYYRQIGGTENIPKEKRRELYRYIFNRTFDLNLIPREYVTKEMVDNYSVQGYYRQIDRIPPRFLTEDICMKYIYHTNKISKISPVFIKKHPNVFKYYLSVCSNVGSIPKGLINREICLEFVKTQKRLPKVPKEFLATYPEIYTEYYNITGNISHIPHEFRSDEMINRFVKNGGNLFLIDEEYLKKHPNLYIDRFSETHRIEEIPESLITAEMCDIYLNEFYMKIRNAVSKIPDRCKEEVYSSFVEKTGRLDLIPNEYKTEGMCLTNFNTDNNIKYIPENYLTEEMCRIYFEKYCLETNENWIDNFLNIPIQFITEEMIDDILARENMSFTNLPRNIKMMMIRSELINIKPGTYKHEIASKFGINDYFLDKVIADIKDNNPDEYEKITKVFKQNSAAKFAVYLRHIRTLEGIIRSLGFIGNKLTKEQQIKFSYLLGREHLFYSLQAISEKILAGKGKDISPFVAKFIDKYLGISAKKKINNGEGNSLTYQDYYAANWGANWLKYFSFDEKFKYVNGKMTTIKFMGNDGTIKEFTKDTVKDVISILIENDIQPINCIVNAALSNYAAGNLDELITQIKSYDNYKEEKQDNNTRRR